MCRFFFFILAWFFSLFFVPVAEADVMCQLFGYCVYQSPGFKVIVVDKETGKPLADVHALASWVQYGYHGTNGPLMVQDVVSGPDGILTFPAWGPSRGSTTGLVLNMDPGISVFRQGYKAVLINNAPGTDEKARVRGFTQDGKTFPIEPFRGTIAEWVRELEKAAYPGTLGRASEDQLRQFLVPYLNRKQRVWAELQKIPRDRREIANFIRAFEDDLKRMKKLSNKQ